MVLVQLRRINLHDDRSVLTRLFAVLLELYFQLLEALTQLGRSILYCGVLAEMSQDPLLSASVLPTIIY
jgi:hypothetical protein